MKKLLVISLLSSVLMANASFKEGIKDVGSQMAEVVLVPARAIKNVIVENEIDQDFVDVMSAYPKFFVEQAQDAKEFTQETADKIANSTFVAHLKKAGSKTVETTKKAANHVTSAAAEVGNTVKEVATQTGDAIKDAATKTGNAVKKVAEKTKVIIVESEILEDGADVCHQFAAAPFQVWAAIKAAYNEI